MQRGTGPGTLSAVGSSASGPPGEPSPARGVAMMTLALLAPFLKGAGMGRFVEVISGETGRVMRCPHPAIVATGEVGSLHELMHTGHAAFACH